MNTHKKLTVPIPYRHGSKLVWRRKDCRLTQMRKRIPKLTLLWDISPVKWGLQKLKFITLKIYLAKMNGNRNDGIDVLENWIFVLYAH